MADTVRLPGLGPTKKTWLYVGGALIAGIVGYAYLARRGGSGEPVAPAAGTIPEDYAADYGYTEGRVSPPTSVGTGYVDEFGAGAIINTNTEWFTAAVTALSDAGYNVLTAAQVLGKFLSRRELTADEVTLVQSAKGFVGEPPQGGPWPIIQVTGPAPTPGGSPPPTPGPSSDPGPIVGGHGTRLTANIRLYDLAKRYARAPSHPDSVEGTKRFILSSNPWLAARGLNKNTSILKAGWIVIVPTRRKVAA